MQTNALVNHGGFPFRTAIHWSPTSLCIPAVRHMLCSTAVYLGMHILTFKCIVHLSLTTCCFKGWFSKVHPEPYMQWLYWQHCGGITGVCIITVCLQVSHWMKQPSIGLVRIHFSHALVFLYPWFVVVAQKRQMVLKRSGKSWGICSSNIPSFCWKHPGVLISSDGSSRTLNLLTENYTNTVTQVMGRIAYVTSLLCTRNVVTYAHHLNNMFVTLFRRAAVML